MIFQNVELLCGVNPGPHFSELEKKGGKIGIIREQFHFFKILDTVSGGKKINQYTPL